MKQKSRFTVSVFRIQRISPSQGKAEGERFKTKK